MRPIKTWVLITDGARARVVVNGGPGRGFEAIEEGDFRSPDLASRFIERDRPGRTFDSQGPGRHDKVPSSDAHEQQERDFVNEVASFIEKERNKGAFDRLILVADPRSLGNLRKAISANVLDLVIGEVSKDLTQTPNSQLAKYLKDFLPV